MLNIAFEDADIHIWTGRPAPPPQADLDLLAVDERARAGRFRFAVDRHRFESARILLRRVLSQYEDVAPADWRFETNPWGKPRITAIPGVAPLQFNVSHSRQHIVCAVTRSSELGIDVEDRIPDDFRDLATAFFAPVEIGWLDAAHDLDQARLRFLTLWTLKEAWVKARGTGLSTPLDGFSVLPDASTGKVRLLTTPDVDPSAQDWRLELVGPLQPACVALAFRWPRHRAEARIALFDAASI